MKHALFNLLKSFSAWACLIFIVLFTVSTNVEAMKIQEYIRHYGNENVKITKDYFVFYNLKVESLHNLKSPMHSKSNFLFDDEVFDTEEYGLPVYDQIEISEDYPAPGLKTVVVPTHGGGNINNGWAYRVFVLSSNQLHCTLIENEFGCVNNVIAGDGLLDITHHSMNSPLSRKGDLNISFYTAVHPKYSQYYLYENGNWRPGNVGELNEKYSMLFSQASLMKIKDNLKDYEIDSVGALIAEETYYCIMSGKSDLECKKHMNMRLPNNMKWITDDFYATVKEDTKNF